MHFVHILIKILKIVLIMLALCLVLLATYYALNYAGIISLSLGLNIYVTGFC